MKKIVFLLCAFMLLCTACQFSTSKSFTFDVDNGDQIKVSLDTTGGFDLSSQAPFGISQNGKVLSEGTFIYSEYYDYYVEGDEIPAWESEGATIGSPKRDQNGNIILYDADGNGSYKQSEIKATIDAEFGHLSNDQKATLWQIFNSSAKNNPYSQTVGQRVLDAKTAMKNN